MDPLSEQKLNDVHPELARRVRRLAKMCEDNGVEIRVTQGLRTWPQQDALYQQGRTTPGKRVTDAPAGHSAHNYGYAIDFVPAREGFPKFTPDWNGMDMCWKQVLAMALQCNLAEGARWRTKPDEPHLYLQELPADPDDEMRYLFSQGGLQGLWSTWNIGAPEATCKMCPHSVLVKIPKPDEPVLYRCMKCGAKHKAEEIITQPKESA